MIAHSVSVMTVQSTAARRVIEDDPERAATALEAIERTGRDAMAEMRRMVSVLRPDPGSAEMLTPQPSLDDLSTLIEQMEAAGLRVDVHVEGERRRVPVAVGVSAYRIVQEALTNTLKHAGTVDAEVVLRYTPGALEIECTDSGDGAGTARSNGGHGLIGMRERASLLGGEVSAAPRADGGFRVQARLPL